MSDKDGKDPMHALFRDTGIQFEHYPFAAATVYPAAVLPWTAISEVVPAYPPELRTTAGEVLFVAETQRQALTATAETAGIPFVSRVDVWDLLLTPFVDTVFDDTYHERVLQQLEANHISREECRRIRRQVEEPMLRYNAVLWEWVHLGLYDLLQAHQPLLSRQAFRKLYWQAMEIASRAKAKECS